LWVPSRFVKPHGPPGLEDEEAETGRLAPGQGAAKSDSTTDQKAVKKQPLAKQMQDSEPPMWSQIKKLMDMVMIVTSSLGMSGNPTATLLAALVIITIQVGFVQGNAYWTFMPNPPMVHPITW
jgi:hypothetical protein